MNTTGGMTVTASNNDLVQLTLDALNPLELPAPVAWWPQTFSSVFFVLLVMLIIIWTSIYTWRVRLSYTYRYQGLALVHQLRKKLDFCCEREDAAREIPELVRRTALAIWPRAQVISLTGQAWLEFLDLTCRESGQAFSPEQGRLLLHLAYMPAHLIPWNELPVLLDNVELWLRHHRVPIVKAGSQ